MKYPEHFYLMYNPDEGSKGDYEVRCQKLRIVTTRKPHKCMCGDCKCKEFPAGTIMLSESAVFDNKFCRWYYSIECLDKQFKEWGW